MTPNIVLVEDDAAISKNYQESLQLQGYQVRTYASVGEAKQGFSDAPFDIAILDITLGDQIEGGYELCQWLRATYPNCGIIMLSSRESDFDTVTGLRLGADDYLTKSTSTGVLFARISALLRRTQSVSAPSSVITQEHLSLDTQSLTASWRGEPLKLTVTECLFVQALTQSPGQVVSRNALMKAASIVVDDSTISSQIKRIRNKFIGIDGEFNQIEAVYGLGYRWNPAS